MPELIYLIGAENVKTAGIQIADAAESINRSAEKMNNPEAINAVANKMITAANLLDDSFDRQQAFLDGWLTRLEQVLDKHKKG